MNRPLSLLVVCTLAVLPLASSLQQTPKAQPAQKVAEKAQYLVQRLRNVQKPGVQMFVADGLVGTPPQLFSVSFELTSNLSYVPSMSCQDPNCMTRRRYDSSSSSTYEVDGATFDVGLGQNTTGFFSRDNLGLAGITLKNQTFGEATHMLSQWEQYLPNDGAFGLGFSSQILDDLKKQDLIGQRVFGLHFGSGNADGELTLGGINEDRYTGEIYYEDISPDSSHWAVRVDDAVIEKDTPIKACGDDGCNATFVSSTPYFILSKENAKMVNEAIGGQPMQAAGSYSFDCTKLCDMPPLTLTVGDMKVTLSARDYTLVSSMPGGLQLCLSGFLGSPYIPEKKMVLGTLFLQKVFTVYDKENNRVGLATSK